MSWEINRKTFDFVVVIDGFWFRLQSIWTDGNSFFRVQSMIEQNGCCEWWRNLLVSSLSHFTPNMLSTKLRRNSDRFWNIHVSNMLNSVSWYVTRVFVFASSEISPGIFSMRNPDNKNLMLFKRFFFRYKITTIFFSCRTWILKWQQSA